MALDIDKLIADTQKARAAADAQKALADKANAALKESKAANANVRLVVDNKLNYANALSQTLSDIETKLTGYAVRIGRGDKLEVGDQKEFDKLLTDYKSTDSAYKKTVKETNSILAKAPSPTATVVKNGKVEVAPTAEQLNADKFNQVPAPGSTITGDGTTTVRDYAKEISTAAPTLLLLKDADRLALANKLNAAGYSVPVTGIYTDALAGAYQQAVGANQLRNQSLKAANLPELNFDQFVAAKQNETTALGGAAGGGTGAANLPYATIASPSSAKNYINQVFQSELKRDATAAELKTLVPDLMKAQAANPTKTKTVNGVRQTIQGLDVGQWITDKAQALPEFAAKKADKAGGTRAAIMSTVNANGIPVSPEQVDTWVKQVENGGDLAAIQRGIRNVAAIGQPESIKKLIADGNDLATIYSPYKTEMARTLEINPDTIQLDDPTLRQAIGPDKEMTIYDFQKALRSDQRWQYTNQARSEASDLATTVLKDFGFMG